MRVVWNILQAQPSHTAQLHLFTPKSALLFLGDTMPIEYMPQLMEIEHLVGAVPLPLNVLMQVHNAKRTLHWLCVRSSR